MIYVSPLEPGVEIPKAVLFDKLKDEASDFMRTLLDLPLVGYISRLRLPVIETTTKARAQDKHIPPLERFLQEQCFYVPGERVLFAEFYERFAEWIAPETCSKQRVVRDLPSEYPTGTRDGNKKYIGNLAWEPKEPSRPWIAEEGKLRLA